VGRPQRGRHSLECRKKEKKKKKKKRRRKLHVLTSTTLGCLSLCHTAISCLKLYMSVWISFRLIPKGRFMSFTATSSPWYMPSKTFPKDPDTSMFMHIT